MSFLVFVFHLFKMLMNLLLSQAVVLGFSLTVRNRDRDHDAIFQNTRANLAELEMVRAQNWAIEVEKILN